MDIKRLAERLVDKHGTRDPFRIAEELGYTIIHTPLGVNPKFCVNSIWGANRAKFIQGGSRGIRLLPC